MGGKIHADNFFLYSHCLKNGAIAFNKSLHLYSKKANGFTAPQTDKTAGCHPGFELLARLRRVCADFFCTRDFPALWAITSDCSEF